MKKGVNVFLIFSLLGIWIFDFISALSFNEILSRGPNEFIMYFNEFFTPFFVALLDVGTYDQYFFSKVLLFILFLVVIFSVTKKLSFIEEDQTAIRLTIAFVVSVLAIRYTIRIELIEAMLLPYSVLAIAISLGIPLMIFGFFIHDLRSPPARRVGWALFMAIFTGIWISRSAELSKGGNIVYALALSIVCIIFIFDRKIHEYLGLKESKEAERAILRGVLADLEGKLESLRSVGAPSRNVDETIKMLEKRYHKLSKKLARI